MFGQSQNLARRFFASLARSSANWVNIFGCVWVDFKKCSVISFDMLAFKGPPLSKMYNAIFENLHLFSLLLFVFVPFRFFWNMFFRFRFFCLFDFISHSSSTCFEGSSALRVLGVPACQKNRPPTHVGFFCLPFSCVCNISCFFFFFCKLFDISSIYICHSSFIL